MSTNCIRCVKEKRTGPDLLCDACRAAKAKHTPGPWVVHDDPKGPCDIIAEGNGRCSPVGQVWATDFEFGKANAQLIAAAPDLLGALKLAATVRNMAYQVDANKNLGILDRKRMQKELWEIEKKIAAVIAKAEGRAET